MPVSRAFPVTKQGLGGLYNVGADYPASNRNLRRTRAALNRVRAGTGSGTIMCVGDSNTRGTGSSATAAQQGYNGWPTKLATLLTARGIKAQSETFFGSGGIFSADGGGYTPATYDDRIVLSGSGIGNPLIYTLGGRLFSATATGSITFTPKTGVTQCDFYYVGTTSAGSISWAVDGGATTTVSCVQSTSGIYKLTIPLGSLGTHAVTIAWVSGTSYFIGMDCYDNTTPLLHVFNCGWHGSTTAQWLTGNSIWSPVQCIPTFFKPDLVVGPALGINDMNTSNNLSVATVAANKQTLLSSWAGTSDTILLTEGPSTNAATPSMAVQKTYNDADYALAAATGIPLLDEFAAMGDEAFMETFGLYNSDHLHKTGAGNYATASMVANALFAVG